MICTTYGEGGLSGFLRETFARFGTDYRVNTRFTLENAPRLLQLCFSQVDRIDYPDTLVIDDPEALLQYMQSLTGMAERRDVPWDAVGDYLRSLAASGPIRIPKAYGAFICRP